MMMMWSASGGVNHVVSVHQALTVIDCVQSRTPQGILKRPRPPVLPPGWELVHDEEVGTYYLSVATGEASWTPPRVLGAEEASSARKSMKPSTTPPSAPDRRRQSGGAGASPKAVTPAKPFESSEKPEDVPLPAYAAPPPVPGVIKNVEGQFAINFADEATLNAALREGGGRGIMAAVLRSPWRFRPQAVLRTYSLPTALRSFCNSNGIR
jgi:hypothetical protein